MSFQELDKDSRRISVGRKSLTQVRVYGLCIIDEYVDDLTDEQVALDYFYDNAPAFVSVELPDVGPVTLYLDSLELSHQSMYTWKAEATYNLPEDNGGGVDLVQIGFNTTGGTKTMTKSLQVKASAARTGSPYAIPDLKGAIGYTKSGVNGVEVKTKGFGFNLTVYFSPSIWNSGLLNTFYELGTCYNNATFMGFAAGEVLYVDSSATGSFYQRVPVTHNFIANPNVVSIADEGFPALTANGHDVVDYLFYDEVGADDQLIQVPEFRFVHRVYDPANLDPLLG
jgi:hypothetical protein